MSTIEWEDVIELAEQLMRERLFLSSEQQQLQQLNDKVQRAASRLAQQAWVGAQLRVNLNRLIVASGSPPTCCLRANQLEQTSFIDGHKRLGFQECLQYGGFLQALRSSPALLAGCLAAAERLGLIPPPLAASTVTSLLGGLYGGCLLADDERLVLKLLRQLIALQIAPSSEPRRLLRPASCIFSRLYSAWHGGLFAAKLFLTGALHEPILHMLSEDDVFLDIDQDKTLLRFSSAERARKFGTEGTEEFSMRLQEHRDYTVSRLVSAVQNFISGIQESVYMFPLAVKWLVRQLHTLLSESGCLSAREVSVLCTDLVFGSFICPAVVSPEPYGITELPVSIVARSNLMQVAQVLQRLAMWPLEEVSASDLYAQFDKECLSSVMEAILEGPDHEEEEDGETQNCTGLSRTAALFTEHELHSLVSVLQSVGNAEPEGVDCKALSSLLSQLPVVQHNGIKSGRLPSPPGTPSPRKNSGLLSKVSRTKPTREVNGEDLGDDDTTEQIEEVLVIPFGSGGSEFVGLLPESKVLMRPELTLEVTAAEVQTQEKRTRFSLSHDEGSIVSTGNVSDNLEAVSEAASNHSAASSLDIEEGGEGEEDPPDNLSDMVSANVSGRGTPSISGRDTPSSQVTEGEEVASGNQGQQRGGGAENSRTPQLGDFAEPGAPPTMPSSKQHSRSDIDDKFGKFEIKKLIEGDETFSLVSDTWSTDVLASDSETVEQSSEHNFPTPASLQAQHLGPPLGPGLGSTLLDVSETASEAWSTDVVASDSERMGEVDTDDTGSVARSDDTARSEVDVDGTRDTPPLAPATAMSFRPIRVELPVLREAPSLVTPRVSLGTSSASSTLTRSSETFQPPSPPTSTLSRSSDPFQPPSPPVATLTRASDAFQSPSPPTHALPPSPTIAKDGDGKLRLESKSRMLSTSTRSEDSTDSKQASSLGLDMEVGASPAPRLSTTSLASSSSSSAGTSDHRGHSCTPVLQCVEITTADKPPNTPNSTGAIPKSISFDKTAERGDRDLDDDPKHKRGSFFRSFKLPFKSRGRKPPRAGQEDSRVSLDSSDAVFRNRRHGEALMDSEEILAKYRRKPGGGVTSRQEGKESVQEEEGEDERLHIDPLHPEQSYAFSDAKRKLRLVLSTADAEGIRRNVVARRGGRGRAQDRLLVFLRLQLTEALNIQDEALAAQIHEALRCVRLFDDAGCRKLLQGLREDYFKRAPYVAYMTRSKAGLLDTLAHIKRLTDRVRREHHICARHLVSVCVRLFLEQREARLSQFQSDFQQLSMPDEKSDLLDVFLQSLASDMERDHTWRVASEAQLEMARQTVEQAVMGRVYLQALYPNGEGDISRDLVLQEHMKRLSQIITLNHKDLRVPKAFQYECPWPSAQAEIAVLGACKTPRDKVRCVLDCAKTIMYLLGLAHERSAPAADDFTPVLVYVLIKANPPSLLSTVQYVNSFYGSQLQGEEEYWWVQFCSAIEYIKTMDYVE